MSVDLTGQRLGHYLVHEVIGRGGMSVVYRATDQRLERSVALKVMSENLSVDPEFRARFTEEARAASAIDHVNVVPLYDFGEVDGALFIAMRLVDGTDLARELASGPMPVRRVLNLLGQVGAALDMLHDRGLVHLDVKPANVLITRNESAGHEHVYLADFGLTRRGTGDHRTASADFLGSPTYASPEHLRGQEIVPRSDEYSLTCMLFTALAGRAPFVGDVRTVITGHLAGVVPSLSALTDLPGAIDRVIARGLAADPASRYASSSDLLSAAKRAVASEDDVLSSVDPPPSVQSSSGSTAGHSMGQDRGPTPARTGAAIGSPTVGRGAGPVQYAAGHQHPPQNQRAPQSQHSSPSPWPARPPQQFRAPAPPYPPPPARQSPSQPPAQVRLAQFGPDTTGRRPASHRIEPAKPSWPWITAGAVIVVVTVVLVFLLTRGSGSAGAPATVDPDSGTSAPARLFPQGSLTLLEPSVVPTR